MVYRENRLSISVIGCGRWGSLIAWYLNRIGHTVTLYGRRESKNFHALMQTRSNGLLTLPESVALSSDLLRCVEKAEVLVISIPSQQLRTFMEECRPLQIKNKTLVLCMKGLEVGSGKRLSEVAAENLDGSNRVAVWLGPGHVQEFYRGVPNCMVIDSRDAPTREMLVEAFSSPLIRFYYGGDLIGNELGAAAKNVIGIAAGFLDGLGLGTLKGALMSRGTREISRLIGALGGNPLSAYGLCHLGDYEATVFSPYSHNRAFGEAFVRGQAYKQLAEGYETCRALVEIAGKYHVETPICLTVYRILFEQADPRGALDQLFTRKLKEEF